MRGLRQPPVAAVIIALTASALCSETSFAALQHDHAPAAHVRADTGKRYTRADVQFMHGMIAHHGQALAMTALVPARTERRDIRLLAERIDASQKTEIEMMQRWLKERNEEVPSADASHAHHEMSEHGLMPGMLTDAELAQLEKATGPAFDRLFLQDMIRHHQGALTMVKNLLGSTGAAQEPEIFRFVSDVEADQSAEIKRMTAMLAAGSRSKDR